MTFVGRLYPYVVSPVPLLIGIGAAGFACIPIPAVNWSIAAAAVFLCVSAWTIARPHRWLMMFFAAAILLPPLPLTIGNSGPHPALFFAGIGLAAGALSTAYWRALKGPLPLVLALFIAALLQSVMFAAIYSGAIVALGSFVRVLLFAIGPYVFVYALSVKGAFQDDIFRSTRLLFRMAVLGAAFACIDFYFQFPAPAGYAAQFVWLDDLVIRRAQGLFYESSTLGNFCAFFLVMILAALVCRRGNRPCARWELITGGGVLAVALVFSYSRGSLLNLVCAGLAMLYVRRITTARWLFAAVLCIGGATASVYFLFPSFGQNYWLRLEASVFSLPSAPADVLSGRLSNWNALSQFAVRHPWQLVLGVGYKTLPYSEYVGRTIIADNTYLDLLVETGVVGLGLFLMLNFFVLRGSCRAARSARPKGRFLGTWIFCFWIGELVQMFSGDLITYWRVLPIYFWVLAAAFRESAAGQRGRDLQKIYT